MNITEEQVREVLEKHVNPASDISSVTVTSDGISFRCRIIDYEINNNQANFRVVCSTTWVTNSHNAYMDRYKNDNVDKAIAELITLLTQQPTLKEQVEEILKGEDRLSITHVRDDEVSVQSKFWQYWVTETHVTYAKEEQTIDQYCDADGLFSGVFKRISALLTSASYSATARGIEKLKAEHERVLEFANQRCDELRAKVTELEETIKDLESAAITGQGRINSLDDQLQSCISEADHEREMLNWETAFGTINSEYQRYKKLSEQYRQWFEDEYAKNNPVCINIGYHDTPAIKAKTDAIS